MKIKYIAIFLVLLCCIMGAASAAEDVSTDIVSDSVDDVAIDEVFEDTFDSNNLLCIGYNETLCLEDKDFEDEEQSRMLSSTNSIENGSILGVRDKDEIHVNNSGSLADALSRIKDGGVIYLADSNYSGSRWDANVNCTIIGCNKDKVIFDNKFWSWDGLAFGYNGHPVISFINITFKNPTLDIIGGKAFINCTFINSSFLVGEYINYAYMGAPENYAFDESFTTNFTNCNFLNFTSDGSLVDIYRFSSINFQNCSFDNISAKSIVNKSYAFTLNDAINFYECSFNNVNVKGIVDVPTRANPFERYVIEDCIYNGALADNFDVWTENNRDYVNATYRVVSVLTVDIDEDGNLVINLKDSDGNAIAYEEILVSLNGEITPYGLDENGTLSIDLTDFRGELNITASFEGSDDYKSAFSSMDIFLVVKTVTEVINNTVTEYVNKTLESTNIVGSDLIATAKVAKTLSVTLKDANGKAIAKRAIAYSINGVTKTVTTDANGIAKIAVNQAKAGSYYYYLCFLGDNDYKASFKSVKVTVNKQVTKAVFKAKTFKVKAKSKKVSFTLKDAKGKAIANKKVTFTVNKKTYTAKTNRKGIATVNLKISKKGKYNVIAKFAGDSTYKAISKKAKITIK